MTVSLVLGVYGSSDIAELATLLIENMKRYLKVDKLFTLAYNCQTTLYSSTVSSRYRKS